MAKVKASVNVLWSEFHSSIKRQSPSPNTPNYLAAYRVSNSRANLFVEHHNLSFFAFRFLDKRTIRNSIRAICIFSDIILWWEIFGVLKSSYPSQKNLSKLCFAVLSFPLPLKHIFTSPYPKKISHQTLKTHCRWIYVWFAIALLKPPLALSRKGFRAIFSISRCSFNFFSTNKTFVTQRIR